LDLKLDNLFIGDDYQIKVADFDNSYIKSDLPIRSKGTKCYRAPEIVTEKCHDPAAADVYSLGVVLFVMKSAGFFPHYEGKRIEGVDFYSLLTKNPKEFWQKQAQLQKRSQQYFTPHFRVLIEDMLAPLVKERATIEQIKNYEWLKGSVYTPEELKEVMVEKFIKKEKKDEE